MATITDKLSVGSRVIIANDTELRGDISIASGTVIHPKATILAIAGPISIGSDCIIEEHVAIVNRRKHLMRIGDQNLFEVGCRIEAASVGSHNTFEPKSRVSQHVAIGSFSSIGAGCTVQPSPSWPGGADAALAALDLTSEAQTDPISIDTASDQAEPERIPDRTVFWGDAAQPSRRLWSGEGVRQAEALHAKHLEYLRETLPKVNKLKIIQ